MNDTKFLDVEAVQILTATVLKDYNDFDQRMFIAIAERTQLDPFTRELMIRPEKFSMDKDGHFLKAIIIAGYQALLKVADRSGLYDGADPWEWCGKEGKWTHLWIPTEAEPYPFAARVSCYRKDHSRAETAIVKWTAHVARDKEGNLTAMWHRMPDFMLGKCALASALRKLFPSLLTGLYEEDEIRPIEPEATTKEQQLAADIAAQQARIAKDAETRKRMEAEGIKSAQHTDQDKPRDARAEVEPPDDIPYPDPKPAASVPQPPQPPPPPAPPPPAPPPASKPPAPAPDPEEHREPGWWQAHVLTTINNDYYRDKRIDQLTESLLEKAVKSWIPQVTKLAEAGDPRVTAQVKLDYEAVNLAWKEVQRIKAK